MGRRKALFIRTVDIFDYEVKQCIKSIKTSTNTKAIKTHVLFKVFVQCGTFEVLSLNVCDPWWLLLHCFVLHCFILYFLIYIND